MVPPPTKEAPLFGQRLAAVRRSKGLSQHELAERLAVTREMVDYYERRAPNPALDFIERAAVALKVSVPISWAASRTRNAPSREQSPSWSAASSR